LGERVNGSELWKGVGVDFQMRRSPVGRDDIYAAEEQAGERVLCWAYLLKMHGKLTS